MASLALGVAGAVVGSYFGPVGAQVGFLIGSYLGGFIDRPHEDGPRINDKQIQASTYGIPIPIVYGTDRVAGNIIWAAELREVETNSDGKGGVGPTQSTFSYYATFAVSLCNNEITTVRRIWADGKLIYDASDGNSGPLGITPTEAFFENININDVALPLIVYRGTETQTADATQQAYLGAGNVPAYRGQAYAQFTDLPVEQYGNRIPNLSFEVVAVGTVADQVTRYTPISGIRSYAVYNPLLNEVWMAMAQTTAADPYMVRLNADTGEVVGYVYGAVVHEIPGTTNFDGEPLYDPLSGSIYVASSNRYLARIDAATGIEVGSFDMTGSWPIGLNGPYLNPVTGDLWLFTSATHSAYEIDKYTGAITATVGFTYNFGAAVFDDYLGRGWLLLSSGFDATIQQKLWKLDEFGTAVTLAYTHTSTLDQITYDSLRHVLLIHSGTGTVIEYDVVADTILTGSTITLAHTPTAIVYDPQRDLLLASNWSTERFFPSYAGTGEAYKDIGSTHQGLIPMSGHNAVLMAGGATTNFSDWSLIKIRFDVVTSDTVLLADIVADLCERSGLGPGDIDVSELLDEVLGYAVTRQDPAVASVQQLAVGFLFDGIESDDVIKFPKRGRASAVTIPQDDLAAHEAESKLPDVLTKTRAQDVELPERLTLVYTALALDYAQGAQLAERLAVPAPDSGRIMTVDAPIVFTDDYAKQLADALMFNTWTERTKFKFATSLKYAKYEPTDVVTVVDTVLRITTKQESGGVVSWEGVRDDSVVYAQEADGVGNLTDGQTVDTPAEWIYSFFTPMDTALLRDGDDAPGFYAASGGYLAEWPGSVLYKSSDGGVTWAQARTFATQPTEGVATGALGDFSGGNTWDELNTLTVTLWAGTSLSSATRLAVLNGANAAALKAGDYWEILQFHSAELNSDGTYTLTGLLRGRKGSEYAMGGHAAGDAFVLLDTASLANIEHSSAEIGLEREYRAVTIGALLANAPDQAFTNNAVRLECLAPVHLGGGRNASGDITGRWVRRTRIGGEWRDAVDVPLGEDSELYDAEVYDGAGYATVMRTFADLTSATFTYTAAQQTTDFGGLQSRIYVKVYQKSTAVGRGFAATGAF